MRQSMAIFCCFALGCTANNNAAIPDPMWNYPLGCTIVSSQTEYELGKQPEIAVRLINLGAEEICLVGNMDASDYRWRYPYCEFEIIRPNGQTDGRFRDSGRCGNYGLLEEQYLVPVFPNAEFDPFQRIDEYGYHRSRQFDSAYFDEPGDYKIRFYYSSMESKIEEWAGDGSDVNLLAKFKKVPKTTIYSAWITVRIVPKASDAIH